MPNFLREHKRLLLWATLALTLLVLTATWLTVAPPFPATNGHPHPTPGSNSGIAVAPLPDPTATAHPTPTPTPITIGHWHERILNPDGSINWDQYTAVANHYDQLDTIDYRLGPTWADLHPDDPNGATLPTLWGAPDRGITDGWYRWHTSMTPHQIFTAPNNGWYSNAGQLLYAPANANDHGVLLAHSFASYFDFAHRPPDWHAWQATISWSSADEWYLTNPDYSVTRKPVIAANDGAAPSLPIAEARSDVQRGMIGVLIYKNGLIVGARNDAQVSQFNAVTRLPDYMVPTAVSVTPGNEFALVTVWNTRDHKGQVAVVAIQGMLDGTHGGEHDPAKDSDPTHYAQDEFGLPNWFYMKSFKILGYVDLPFAAPTAIATSLDRTSTFDARGNGNVVSSLSLQSERDKFFNVTDDYHVAARAGYAVVSSRAENKVAFIDLKPLLQYYRTMYFTTQDNYNQTQQKGPGDNQWPYTFSAVPQQMPTVTATLSVPQPTTVAAGIQRSWNWVGDDTFKDHAFVATLDGHLQVYNVTNLNSTAPSTTPTLVSTQQVGHNPTSIMFGNAAGVGDILWLTSRADRAIYRLHADGTIINKLQDKRIKDPVYAFKSYGYGIDTLSVMDFDGHQALSYLTDDLKANVDGKSTADYLIPVANGTAPFEFSSATPVPGSPFMFQVCEVF